MAKKKSRLPLNLVLGVASAGLAGVAIVEQLRRPKAERTWQGRIVGIPYDFRKPDMERMRSSNWNSETSDIIVPQPFGVGWTFNLYPIIHPKHVDETK